MNKPSGLIVDWGGVLTTPIGASWRQWAVDTGVDVGAFDALMSEMLHASPDSGEAARLSHAYERGELTDSEFENYLISRLRPHAPELREGVLLDLWRELAGVPDMIEVVRRAKWHGLRTALLSNSWGLQGYDRTDWDELFDAVVLSGQVGMRKPDADIYLHAAAALGVKPGDCVFVDDLYVNVQGAVAVGMIGVHHTKVATTVAELEALFGVEFRV